MFLTHAIKNPHSILTKHLTNMQQRRKLDPDTWNTLAYISQEVKWRTDT